jgi:hypothetical protein
MVTKMKKDVRIILSNSSTAHGGLFDYASFWQGAVYVISIHHKDCVEDFLKSLYSTGSIIYLLVAWNHLMRTVYLLSIFPSTFGDERKCHCLTFGLTIPGPQECYSKFRLSN